MTDPLYQLARTYHEQTENYDRRVCSGLIVNGEIRPANDYESSLIDRNARIVYRRLLDEALTLGYSEKQFNHAMKLYPRL